MKGGHIMLFMDDILARKRFMLRRKEQLERRLAEIPKGRLKKKRARGETYFYLEEDGKLQSLQQKFHIKKSFMQMQEKVKSYRKLYHNLYGFK